MLIYMLLPSLAEMWAKVDDEIGKRLDEALSKMDSNPDHMEPSSRALAMHRK